MESTSEEINYAPYQVQRNGSDNSVSKSPFQIREDFIDTENNDETSQYYEFVAGGDSEVDPSSSHDHHEIRHLSSTIQQEKESSTKNDFDLRLDNISYKKEVEIVNNSIILPTIIEYDWMKNEKVTKKSNSQNKDLGEGGEKINTLAQKHDEYETRKIRDEERKKKFDRASGISRNSIKVTNDCLYGTENCMNKIDCFGFTGSSSKERDNRRPLLINETNEGSRERLTKKDASTTTFTASEQRFSTLASREKRRQANSTGDEALEIRIKEIKDELDGKSKKSILNVVRRAMKSKNKINVK